MNGSLDLLHRLGVFHAARRVRPEVLTVLNYHRVEDITRSGFDTFAPNVAASPPEFARQMEYLQRHYRVIGCEHLSAWLRGEGELPSYAAMITFDDGYADNFVHAYPILKGKKLPATIFLATGQIGSDEPFYWDRAAYFFHHSRKTSANLPLQGPASWVGEVQRHRVLKQWVEQIKLLPEGEKRHALACLADALDVRVPESAFSGLYLSWDQAREMSRNGIEMGSHTASHPILTRIPLSQVESELVKSKQKIESEIERPVIAFAYPNGRRSDFSPPVMKLVQQAGYQLAFSLLPGATSYTQVRRQPLAIKRIFLSTRDPFPRFAAKLVLGRLIPA